MFILRKAQDKYILNGSLPNLERKQKRKPSLKGIGGCLVSRGGWFVVSSIVAEVRTIVRITT